MLAGQGCCSLNVLSGWKLVFPLYDIPDSKIHGTNMGPTWVLSAPDGPHVGLMNLAIWDAWLAVCLALQSVCCYCRVWRLTPWEKTACLNGVPKCWDFEAHHGKVDIEPSLHNQWCPDYPQWPSQLALRRWPNVNPLCWANVGTPTLGQRGFVNWPNVGAPTLRQHRPNVGTLMLGQRWHNVTPMVVCQRCTNIGPTAFLIMGCDLNGCMFGCVDQWNISSWYGNVFCVTGLRLPMDSPH